MPKRRRDSAALGLFGFKARRQAHSQLYNCWRNAEAEQIVGQPIPCSGPGQSGPAIKGVLACDYVQKIGVPKVSTYARRIVGKPLQGMCLTGFIGLAQGFRVAAQLFNGFHNRAPHR